MPKKAGSGVLHRIRKAQTDVMNDTVTLYRIDPAGRDDYGAPTDAVTGTYSLTVGLDFTPRGLAATSNDSQQASISTALTLLEYDVVMRVDKDQTVLQDDIVLIQQKAGITGSFGNYSVYGNPDILNSSVKKVYLKRIT